MSQTQDAMKAFQALNSYQSRVVNEFSKDIAESERMVYLHHLHSGRSNRKIFSAIALPLLI